MKKELLETKDSDPIAQAPEFRKKVVEKVLKEAVSSIYFAGKLKKSVHPDKEKKMVQAQLNRDKWAKVPEVLDKMINCKDTRLSHVSA